MSYDMDIFQLDVEHELQLNGVYESSYTHDDTDEFVVGGISSLSKYNSGKLSYISEMGSFTDVDENGLVIIHPWLVNRKLNNKYITYHKYISDNTLSPLVISLRMDVCAMIDDFISSRNLDVSGWFLFGSMVIYELSSYSGGKLTDIDVVVITDDVEHGTKFNCGLLDIQTMTVEYFNSHNDGSDELILQMLFHRNISFDWKRSTVFYNLGDTLEIDAPFDHSKIRRCISGKSSNSYVKAKKKLIVEGDYDKYASMKSLIHSFRLLNLGICVSRSDGLCGYSKEYDTTLRGINVIRELYSSLSDDEIVESIENGTIKEYYKALKRAFKQHCAK